jgi:methylenetetrahydrofolate dehydrogenase (NADP+)/methenyltetrahydrofolate cyclohydrolase
MTAEVLSGKELAAEIRAEATDKAQRLAAEGTVPTLVVVTATDDEGSAWYVSSIKKAAEKTGIACEVRDLGQDADRKQIAAELDTLAKDGTVHGVILQTPLPKGVSAPEMASHIALRQDVDGANPLSLGNLVAGLWAFPPATAAAVIRILKHYGFRLEGMTAAVVGRSTVVGKPLAHLLLDENATVTIAHSRTLDLPKVTRAAQIVVAAVGRTGLITSEHVSPGAIVIDVGTNQDADGNLVGDVDAVSVKTVAKGLTPVPGGVGPVTTALLLAHVVKSAEAHHAS